MMGKRYNCPCCGQDITGYVSDAFNAQRSEAGKTKTKKKSASSAANMRKAAAAANAAYTPEKRKAAAEKRRKTMEAKKNAGI